MCVLIVKPAGVDLPEFETLKAAFSANPHGCGYATPTRHFKSLKFDNFYKSIKEVSRDEPCIIHFRLATHGSIRRANCHPFRRGDVWFAHNGILSIRPKGDMTDSETAFQTLFYPTISKFGLNHPFLDMDVKSVIGDSKFAFMQGDNLRMFGNFTEEEDGCFYSNLRWRMYLKPQRVKHWFLNCASF